MKTFKKNKKNISYKKKYNNLQKRKFSKLKGKNKNKYSKIKGGASNLFAPIKKDKPAAGLSLVPLLGPRKQVVFKHQPVPISKLELAFKETETQSKIKKYIKSEIDKVFNNQPDKEFELIEVTNTFFQIKYNYYNAEDEYKPLFFFVNPDILSVDKLQYFINNKKITINNNNIQISENTITLKSLRSGGHYRTGGVFETVLFKNVYEDSQISLVSYEENLENLRNPINGKYHINVMGIEYDPPNLNKESLIVEDIAWINEIMIELSRVNPNLNKEGENKTNLELFLEKSKSNPDIAFKTDYKPRIFSCVDLDVDHSKIIIEEYKLADGEEYVIVGYPKDTMRPYLDLYNKNKDMFDSIYGVHKNEFMKYIAELHNFIAENKLKISLDNLKDEIHNFYRYEKYYQYTENFYKNAFKECIATDLTTKEEVFKSIYGIDYDPEFQTKFKDLQKAFYNELASKCLNKPMMQIQYVFLIFKKLREGNNIPKGLNIGDYVPAVFNFRELKHKHHPILQRLEKVIKSVLPNRYGITASEAEEYKLWYSHYNYGDVFHIKTEYVHTMSNIHQQAYKYSNSIILEELIYMLSIEGTDLKNLRVEYQRKKVNFEFIDGIRQTFHEGLATQAGVKTTYKIHIESVPTNLLDLSTFLNSNILLMFVQTGKLYTFVYKKDDKFYIIKFKPSIYNIITKIFDTLQKHILKAEFLTKLLSSRNSEFIESIDISGIDLYEVLEHRPINNSDYKIIMRYNPLLVRTVKQKSTDLTISISEFFDSPLINNLQLLIKTYFNNNEDLKIPNPYNKKALLIRNFLATDTYKKEFNTFKSGYKNNISYNYNLDEKCNEEKSLADNLNEKYEYQIFEGKDNKRRINRIFFNPDNCRYNFIEICDKIKNVIWIVPLNATFSTNTKEENELEFSNNQIPSNQIPSFIGNFLYLNNEHIKMLETLNNLFNNETYECFFNISSITPIQFCLHAHAFNRNNIQYSNPVATLQQGSRIEKFFNIKTIINCLKLGKIYKNEYYNEYKSTFIIHD